MGMEQETMFRLFGIAGLIGMYVVYRLLTRPNKEFQEEINTVLHGEEHKVKNQFDVFK